MPDDAVACKSGSGRRAIKVHPHSINTHGNGSKRGCARLQTGPDDSFIAGIVPENHTA
jgi:hypothetical protein